MPELPEVQTMVTDLNKKIKGLIIEDVWFDAPSIIKYPKPDIFKKEIKNYKIAEIKRRGKNILIYLERRQQPTNKRQQLKKSPQLSVSSPQSSAALLIHPKMTGHLLIGQWNITKGKPVNKNGGDLASKVNSYIHLIFYLENDQRLISGKSKISDKSASIQLAFSDVRKFGKIMFGPKDKIENLKDLKNLGPEPLDDNLKFNDFKNLFLNKKKPIKQVLLDQQVIAGIGNIYADEILWLSEIYPLKPACKLSEEELKKIYSSMKKILKIAIKLRGTSMSDYRDTSGKIGGYYTKRLVYKNEGKKCLRCANPIKRIKIGQRSAHYCEICQKN